MNNASAKSPAQTYEDYFVPAMFRQWTNVLLQHANLQRGEWVLDVACGTGIVTRHVAPLVGAGGHVVGVDVNPGMLAVARSLPPAKGATIDWQQGNAVSLLYPDGVFDVVLCQHGLQFIAQRDQAITEMRRVLSPGGRAAVIVLQSLELHPLFEAMLEAVAHHLSLSVAEVTTPFSLPDENELGELFRALGFARVSVLSESMTASFPDPTRFVALSVMSSSAAVPAFAQLSESDRTALIEKVRGDVMPVLDLYRSGERVEFPMFAHVAVATT